MNKNKRKIILSVFLAFLAILAVWFFAVQKKDVWFQTCSSVDGEKDIVFNDKTPDIRLISESRGEFSYQANYIYDNKDDNSSETIKKKLKRDFSGNGWRLENEKIEEDHQFLDFKNKKKNESLKVVIGYRNGRGTFFSFDYR